MKKILLFLFIVYVSLSTVLQAENINECKTDIYYGNGVWNEYEDADKSKNILRDVVNEEIIIGNPRLKTKYSNVKLAYNWGQGQILDVLETYYQLREAGQLEGVGFYTAISALTASIPHIALGAIAIQALMEPFTRDWEEGNVDEMWQKYYNESFKLGHRVLLVSHSQGNLFANRIHDIIFPAEYRNYIANFQVASPASSVNASKGGYVTLYGDPIINPIPGSMDGNANGSAGHAFVAAYLNQSDPYEKIVEGIKQLLPTLDSEISQWETNEEFERNTCDYRITVKHRFDPDNVVMDKMVYPFAPAKKLYQVNGEYVKATCGGTKIFDEWEGKKDNECLMINNPQEEIVILEEIIKLYIAYYVERIDWGLHSGRLPQYGHGVYVNNKILSIDDIHDYYQSDRQCNARGSDWYGYSNYYFGDPLYKYIPRVEDAMISTNGNVENSHFYNSGIGDPLKAIERVLGCILYNKNKTLNDISSIEKGTIGQRYEIKHYQGEIEDWYIYYFKEYIINMK